MTAAAARQRLANYVARQTLETLQATYRELLGNRTSEGAVARGAVFQELARRMGDEAADIWTESAVVDQISR